MEDKKLYRIPSEGSLAGVCAGLGKYLSIDPVILRALFAALSLPGGFGILLYLAMWLIVPIEPPDEETPNKEAD